MAFQLLHACTQTTSVECCKREEFFLSTLMTNVKRIFYLNNVNEIIIMEDKWLPLLIGLWMWRQQKTKKVLFGEIEQQLLSRFGEFSFVSYNLASNI